MSAGTLVPVTSSVLPHVRYGEWAAAAAVDTTHGQLAAAYRARQVFGIDEFEGEPLEGMDEVYELFGYHLKTDSTAVGLTYRPWEGPGRHHRWAPWARTLGFGADVQVAVEYRLGDKFESDGCVRLDRLWRYASGGAEITMVRAPEGLPTWFVGMSDIVVGEHRYMTYVEDLRGLGTSIWNPSLRDHLFSYVRGAMKQIDGANERAKGARAGLVEHDPEKPPTKHDNLSPAIHAEQVESFAVADYLTAPMPDSGPPAHIWMVLEKHVDHTGSRVLAASRSC